jgi:hypothetical protein
MLMRPELVARGVDFIPTKAVRQSNIASTLARRRFAIPVPLLRDRLVARAMAEKLDALRQGPETVVLSDENFLGGGAREVFAAPIYPHGARMAHRFASLRARAEVTLFLGIRGFETQLPSAYAQELRIRRPPEGGFEAIRRGVIARPPRWSDLVARILRAAPRIPLRVWRYEDYRGAHCRDPRRALRLRHRASAADQGSRSNEVALPRSGAGG